MLNRMTELATRAANGINEDSNRASLQKEVTKAAGGNRPHFPRART